MNHQVLHIMNVHAFSEGLEPGIMAQTGCDEDQRHRGKEGSVTSPVHHLPSMKDIQLTQLPQQFNLYMDFN